MSKETICIRIEKEHIDKLKEIAREKSYKNKEDIAYSDLIRELIEKYAMQYEDKNGKI